MNVKTLLVIILSFTLFACKRTVIVDYMIIPEPQSISYSSGSLKLEENIRISFPSELLNEAELLKGYLKNDFAMLPETVSKELDADILLQLDAEAKSENPDGYKLEVNKRQIIISSNSKAGVLNGIQSLRQIIRKQKSNFIVQSGVIIDFPAFQWRSLLLDEGRYFKGKQVVTDLLDEMALLKMNVFHWHLTEDQGWRIEIKKYPKLTEVGAYRDSSEINHFHSDVFDGKAHGGYYTQEEIKEVVEYAAERHIMVVPEIEMPGHASAAIAAYPWLGVTGKQIKVPAKFGVQYDVYNVADPKVLTFLNDVIDEVISLFPSPVFHIGGDEVRYNHWNESRQVQSYIAENGLKSPAELQLFFTNNISNLLQDKGKRMMGWNEITGDKVHGFQRDEDKKDVSLKLADKTIVHFWKGDSKLMLRTIQNGYDIVNSHHPFTYIAYDHKFLPLSKAYSFNPIPKDLPSEFNNKVLGMCCAMWGEFIPTVESMNYMIYPRIAAYAECGWTTAENKNFDRFRNSLPWFLNRWKEKGIIYGPLGKEGDYFGDKL